MLVEIRWLIALTFVKQGRQQARKGSQAAIVKDNAHPVALGIPFEGFVPLLIAPFTGQPGLVATFQREPNSIEETDGNRDEGNLPCFEDEFQGAGAVQ